VSRGNLQCCIMAKKKNADGYATVRIPVELAHEIDEIVKSGVLGYKTRSELVKDAVRQKIELLRYNNLKSSK
jgi:metal-responsive CopG/Arc/MetJ family transcriptional regulator